MNLNIEGLQDYYHLRDQLQGKTRPRTIRTLLLIMLGSFLLHLVILFWLALWAALNAPAKPNNHTMEINLQQPQPQPEKKLAAVKKAPPQPKPPEPKQAVQPEEQVPLPRHNAEVVDLTGNTFAKDKAPKAGQDRPRPKPAPAEMTSADTEPQAKPAQKEPAKDKTKTAETSGKTAVQQKDLAKPKAGGAVPDKPQEKKPTAVAKEKPQPEKPQPEKPQVSALAALDAYKEKLKGLKLLDDQQLRDTAIADSVDTAEARQIRMVNRFLERMAAQVRERMRLPANAQPGERGIILFELDSQGYLLGARVIRPSGNYLLDLSALEAIRSVPRYDVPDSNLIANRYYRNLRFTYAGTLN